MIERLNRESGCLSLDRAALRAALESELGQPGLYALVAERNPHMFSALPVFVAERQLQRMREVVRAVHTVAALPGWCDAALADAPAAARRDPGNPGLFLGFDFHLEGDALSLIEINTNPGGALLSAALARAQRACCDAMREPLARAPRPEAFEAALLEMFAAEWRSGGRDGLPRRLAIVDDAPQQQYLYAEFVLFQRLLARAGIDSRVVDAAQLRVEHGALTAAGEAFDFVYNRLTDFDFAQDTHAALHQAWDKDLALIAPHPRAHALYADKRRLVLLGDAARLRALGADSIDAELLAATVPFTEIVDDVHAERLWAQRRELFFKPWAGFGSRAAYRGDKLTRSVWGDILQGRYVAQRLAPPGRRVVGADALKFDLRAYAYGGDVMWFSARLYQGQTTNFRTPGGGFAPVLGG